MKKNLLIIGAIILVFILFLTIRFVFSLYTTYELGDYGVKLTAINSFQKQESENLLLKLVSSDGITVNVKAFEGDFWKSNDIDSIMNEYLKLTSAMQYDSSITDVSYKQVKLDFKNVGRVEFTADRISRINKMISILTTKSNGYLVIEIFGDPSVMEAKKGQVEGIINSIKFGENKHDYSKDVDRNKNLENLDKSIGSGDSGDKISGENI